MRRSGKFYSNNEKETLNRLGFKAAPQSGAGWIIKEDGENDKYIVQLKSTDASTYRISLDDLSKLEYHADVSHKIPLFIIQFLKQDRLYAVIDISNLIQIDANNETNVIIQEQQNVNLDKNIKKSDPRKRQSYYERKNKK